MGFGGAAAAVGAIGLPVALVGSFLSFVVVIAGGECPDVSVAPGVVVDVATVPAGPIGEMGWSGEQLVNAASVMNAGQALGASVRDQTIAVMTAMGESSLRVLNSGDAAGPDSRGLFQQRTGWGTLECRMDATCSSELFFRALLTVSDRASLAPTLVAHEVQRNADPNHYAKFWTDAQAVVAGLAPAAAPGECVVGAPGNWSAAIELGISSVGVYPYSWGGGDLNGPSYGIDDGASIKGFDCSSFVRWLVYQTWHKELPRTAHDQAATLQGRGFVTVSSDITRLQPGDLVFFSTSADVRTVYHVALVTKAPTAKQSAWIVEEPGRGRFVQHNLLSQRMPTDVWGFARFDPAAL